MKFKGIPRQFSYVDTIYQNQRRLDVDNRRQSIFTVQ